MNTSTETGAPSGAVAPAVRLFVTAALAPDAVIVLEPEQAHYLTHVMRRGTGDTVALFNGRDGEWRARLERTGRHGASAHVGARLRPQGTEPDVWLLFAPIKRARLDYLVEKATELGVAALLPVITRRTVVERVNVERLAAHAREAAEQTERLSVPVVHAPRPLDAIIASWPPERRLLLCDESGAGAPIVTALGQRGAAAAPWAVAIGPEGGFDASERAALAALPQALPVGLGPRLLRADTAALAALACWQAVLGDWHKAPRAG
ncbi:MAG: 16S rRNA (uracil(1498)-N(3))-methyltransferase [Alphaproteobacteria bacterium]|nr:16S rRNA (uracil(1498)-N(3))-methyltransferase [Alphaproteobacteria bacterium]